MQQQRQWKVGDSVQLTKTFGDAEIEKFSDSPAIDNHLDNEAFAARTRFKRRIAQGILSGSLISPCIGLLRLVAFRLRVVLAVFVLVRHAGGDHLGNLQRSERPVVGNADLPRQAAEGFGG